MTSAKWAPMLTYLRYALATFCFAASVGCLGLWGRSYFRCDKLLVASTVNGVILEQSRGVFYCQRVSNPGDRWNFISQPAIGPWMPSGRFGTIGSAIYFPLWYPALVFAIAGVAALRLGRRFTLRSAIIATTVVCGLLGMAVML